MTDISSLLRPPAKSTLPPPVITADIYPGLIKTYEIAQSANGNPMLRLQVALLDWPETVPERDRFQTTEDGEQIPIDLSRKQMRKDFFLTPAAYFRLENFLKAMGHEVMTDAAGNKDYETPVTKLIGIKVGVEVQRILSRNNEFINVVGELLPPRK
jgi:hypothetical protein